MPDHKTTRRRFLQSAAAVTTLTATVAATSVTQAGALLSRKNKLPIIDTHQHLWDLSVITPPWVGTAPEILNQPYATKEFKAATRGLNVVKTVYMEVDCAPSDHALEAEHVIALSKSPRHPTAAAVISGRPAEDSFAPHVRKYKGSPYIKGVRQVLHNDAAPQGLCLGETFVKSMQLLGEQNMSFDLCMRPTELLDGVKLADQVPDTLFIVDHCGNGDPKAFLKNSTEEPWHTAEQWKRDMGELAKRKNIICKISGIIARVPADGWDASMLAPLINHCLDVFGPDRVVFGGDWPVCLLGDSYREWVNALKTVIANRSVTDQRKLLHDNANRIYRLS